MFERKNDVGEKIAGLWGDRPWHCKRAVEPFNAGNRLNACGLLYPNHLQPHGIDQIGITHQISHYFPDRWLDFFNRANGVRFSSRKLNGCRQ
ncbi:hypothetical protein [Pseudomonas sp. NPDC088444]|uniref:hypothetical protein n=1 Tax=Pseudomonas sp. NPDC088444 TaxID=3364456 RepID=UPI00384B4314